MYRNTLGTETKLLFQNDTTTIFLETKVRGLTDIRELMPGPGPPPVMARVHDAGGCRAAGARDHGPGHQCTAPCTSDAGPQN